MEARCRGIETDVTGGPLVFQVFGQFLVMGGVFDETALFQNSQYTHNSSFHDFGKNGNPIPETRLPVLNKKKGRRKNFFCGPLKQKSREAFLPAAYILACYVMSG
jgi:hypothetical protein